MDLMCDLGTDTLLPECHLDDQMWGFAVRMAIEMLDKNVQQIDCVLHCLFSIGIFDWAGFNVRGPGGIRSM